jgi:hypothetical protein
MIHIYHHFYHLGATVQSDGGAADEKLGTGAGKPF